MYFKNKNGTQRKSLRIPLLQSEKKGLHPKTNLYPGTGTLQRRRTWTGRDTERKLVVVRRLHYGTLKTHPVSFGTSHRTQKSLRTNSFW